MKKSIFNVKAEELEERTVRFKISSEVVDRDGDILIAKGCNFENFKKNPQFLGFHNYHEYPLGIPKNWGIEGKAVYCDVYFPTIEELSSEKECASEKAKLVDFTYHCYKTGMLNAVSVGFIPMDAVPNKETGGAIVNEWELLEFSAVTVPANQDAIAQAVKSFGDENAKGMIDPIERIKELEGQIAECHKTMKEQAEKLEKVSHDLDGIELDDEKEITFEDEEEINLDEIK
jgi:hypothetical protein